MGQDTQQLLERVRAVLEAGDDTALVRELAEDRPEDVAEVFELLDDGQRSQIIFALPPRLAAEVIALLDEADRSEVIEDLDDEKLTELVAELPPDDAADVIGELTDQRGGEVLEHVPDEKAALIEELLEYDEESAGGIMTPDLIALTGDTTVGQCVRSVRAASPDEDLHEIYVIDGSMRVLGTVPLRALVINPKETKLADLCEPDPITIGVDEDQEEVVRLFRKYDLAAIPVVDAAGKLVGRITTDDAMDVADEEAAEDLLRMAGTDPSEMETASPFRAAAIRLTWLLPCMLIFTVTAAVIALSERRFSGAVYAAVIAFVPMIGAMSGNSGIQISTVIVRGLATGDLAGTRIGLALRREGVIALLMAPVCGLFAAVITRLGLPVLEWVGVFEGTVDAGPVAGAVGVGMTLAMLFAGGLGILLPFSFRRIGVDPAIASGPIVTTVNDVISVSVYLAIAIAFMG
ncbi:MAG: magnesium transporter [Planctomycetes bacterium]|nr:magnesium transporter [Planctomycetota bacterium]